MGGARPGREIFFSSLAGEAAVYLDGVKIGTRGMSDPAFVRAPVPDGAQGACVLTVVVRNMDEKRSCAGITGAVTLRV